ncbi:unnamed protein product [Aphanomyces euteiches]
MVAHTEVASDVMEMRAPGVDMNAPAYWCHLCKRNVETRLNAESDEVECQTCGGCFVEEVEDDTPGQDRPQDFVPPTATTENNTQEENTNRGRSRSRSAEVSLPGASNQNPRESTDATESPQNTLSSSRPRRVTLDEIFNSGPPRTMRNRIITTRGTPVEVYITGSGSFQSGAGLVGAIGSLFQTIPVGQGIGSTIGDYAFGNMTNIINLLMQNDPNQHGAPPAAKSVVENLPKVHISQEEVDSNHDCAVCKDTFELKEQALRLPCSHDFHSDCILPWLKQHNSCPVCRFELPTDDPDYESSRTTANNHTPSTETTAQH